MHRSGTVNLKESLLHILGLTRIRLPHALAIIGCVIIVLLVYTLQMLNQKHRWITESSDHDWQLKRLFKGSKPDFVSFISRKSSPTALPLHPSQSTILPFYPELHFNSNGTHNDLTAMQYDNPSPPEHKKLNRYRIAQGFRLCTMLEGSTFDAFEPVEAWNWDRAVDRRKPMEALVELVDNVAENIMTTALQALKETAENADIKNKMLRLSCYAAADGSNSLARLSQRPLLRKVDATTYFGSTLPSINFRKNSASTISSKSYKVAYLLQVEAGDTLRIPNVKHLIDLLDDGSSLILIHVDADAPLIQSELGAFIFKRLEDIEIDRSGPRTLADVGNVFLAKNRFSKRRSGSGMLWSMLSGMWELMDLGTGWSHVINISPLDIPVRKAGEVQRVLGLKRNAKKSFVSIEDPAEAADFWAINSAQSYLSAVRREGASDNITQSDVKNISTPRSLKRLMEPMILYSPFQNWNVCKQSPWMILSRESLDFLRSSWTSHRVMAFMEHMKRAEEKFFCYVLMNTPQFKDAYLSRNNHRRITEKNILNVDDMKRLLNNTSAKEDDEEDGKDISEGMELLFASPVDLGVESGWEVWEWLMKHHHMSSTDGVA